MPRDELEGVMAHELMHVKHRDILIGSVAAAIATAISFIANMALWSGMFGGGDDDDRPNPIVLLAASILAPLAAGLLQMAISRSREFEADRGAAELIGTGSAPGRGAPPHRHRWPTRSRWRSTRPRRRRGSTTRWPKPITLAAGVDMARLFSTHPSTEERIARLMAMTPA